MNTKTLMIIFIVGILVMTAGIGVYLFYPKGEKKEAAEVVQKEITEKVKIRSTAEIISEQKFSIIKFNLEGFSENELEVPLGGVLQINNDTTREIILELRTKNYIAGLTVKAGKTGYSPVFTVAGKYTLSESIDGKINEKVSATINVVEQKERDK